MSSELIVPIVEITNIKSHLNADRLEIVELFNGQYQTVIAKDQFRIGDRAIYFPVDCLINEELIVKYNLVDYLTGTAKNRVKCVRLRGEESFGLLVKDDEFTFNHKIDENVADILKVKKWEPRPRVDNTLYKKPKTLSEKIEVWFRKDGIDFHPNQEFIEYTHIKNGRLFTNIFEPDEEVVVTEKIHGANARYAKFYDKIAIGSHSVQRPINYIPDNPLLVKFKEIVCKLFKWSRGKKYLEETLWHQILKYEFMQNFLNGEKNLILFGEIYGPSVQKLTYGVPAGEIQFRAFDIYNVEESKYLDYVDFLVICDKYHIPEVPRIFYGRFDEINIKDLSEGQTNIGGADNIREGIVIRPIKESNHPRIGRKILKYISSQYLLNKKDDEDCVDI